MDGDLGEPVIDHNGHPGVSRIPLCQGRGVGMKLGQNLFKVLIVA